MDKRIDVNDNTQEELLYEALRKMFLLLALACMQSLKQTTNGPDIFNECVEGLRLFKIPTLRACNILAGGDSNTIERKWICCQLKSKIVFFFLHENNWSEDVKCLISA